MIFLYRTLTFFVPVFVLIIFFRRYLNKEDIKRFKEKISVNDPFSKNKKIIWIHAASIGETKVFFH